MSEIPMRLILNRNESSVFDIRVPARVYVAMGFVSMMNMKSCCKIAGNDSTWQCFDGDKLTEEEETASNTACHLLTKYFAGTLPPDKGEDLQFKIMQDAVEKKEVVWLIHCTARCGGSDPQCVFCGGTGLNEVRSPKK